MILFLFYRAITYKNRKLERSITLAIFIHCFKKEKKKRAVCKSQQRENASVGGVWLGNTVKKASELRMQVLESRNLSTWQRIG